MLRFSAKIENGIMVLDDRPAFVKHLKTLEGENVEVEVIKYGAIRTHPQNNYYWGAVITLMSDWTGFTPQEMHDTFKSMFLKETRTSKQGKAYDVVRSTASLSTAEFADYVEKCRGFASMQGLVIPDPSPDAPEAPELPPICPVEPSEPIDPIIIVGETPEPTKEQLSAMFGEVITICDRLKEDFVDERKNQKEEPITITRLDGTKKTYD